MATKRVWPALAVAVTLAVGAGCAATGGAPERRLTPDVAAGLATRAEQVAAALEAGRCDEALTGARSLQTEIAALPAEIGSALRAEALAGATRLANGISCPPPAPPATAPVATAPDLKELEKWLERKAGEGKKKDDD